jgi:hypothetical protein
MLTFLRKIRKSLLESSPAQSTAPSRGSMRRYILYAIGEISLLVIGILIALSINNWNQNNIDRKEEQRILSTINTEIKTLSWQVGRGLATYNDILSSSKLLLHWINDPVENYDKDSIDYHLAVITNRWMFGKGNITNVYDALAGAGELGLIQSDSLRNTLAMVDRQILLLSVYEEFQTKFEDNQLFPFLNDHIDGVKIDSNRSTYVKNKWDMDHVNTELNIKQGRFPTRTDVLFNSQKCSNLLTSHIKNTAALIPIYERLNEYIEQINLQNKVNDN